MRSLSELPSTTMRIGGRLLEPLLTRLRSGRAVRWGGMRRLTPISTKFGLDRGLPIDRYYIEAFLRRHRTDIQGRVLEVGDPGYTQMFGGDQVGRSDVLHVEEGNAHATLVGDLRTGEGIPTGAFD